MKINDTGRVGGVNPYQRNMETQRQEAKKMERRKDEVSISSEAIEMLEAQERSTDPERIQRIQDLKQQVSSGTYHVDSGKIAEKLMPYFKSFPNK
ncbi:flagellar biosynthesis anti-sigma factor FlgM [Paenibacillus dokdonensis]|uniref:flagellar biosynthesis anti-sigma factor FlgM n=1 Tax=Paenibacillus dokdonensis TaxID=2567944 RepID=UPI0010A8FAEE|nr:flagellar biosynthesis anti-sigma factor FlgM [Paenibacillus dokdonensis]